jgi:hypothetical protein
MSASLGYMTKGLVRGFTSPGVPSMQQISPHLVPDDSAVSWICKYVIFPSYKFKKSRNEKERMYSYNLLKCATQTLGVKIPRFS